MSRLKVNLGRSKDESYDVLVKPGATDELVSDLKVNSSGRKFAIIADSNVAKLYGAEIQKKMKKAKLETELFTFAAGEKSKNWDVALDLARKMLKKKFSRSDMVIALGGGVTGDLAGFVASIFMRGIDVVQVPTSLLAMTDAAIGGKTGVNCEEGKNLLGAFHQPLKVYVDVNFLKTLPKEEMENGYAEIVKHAVIGDVKLFRILEKASRKELFRDLKFINEVLVRSCAVKTKIVSRDVKESGLRMKLNLGHTLGHVIEKEMKYKLAHGAAVAIGMVKICDVAVARGMMKHKAALRIRLLLEEIGLPTVLPKGLKAGVLIKGMSRDKKMKKKKLYFIVPLKIGKVMVTDEVKAEDFKKVL